MDASYDICVFAQLLIFKRRNIIRSIHYFRTFGLLLFLKSGLFSGPPRVRKRKIALVLLWLCGGSCLELMVWAVEAKHQVKRARVTTATWRWRRRDTRCAPLTIHWMSAASLCLPRNANASCPPHNTDGWLHAHPCHTMLHS